MSPFAFIKHTHLRFSWMLFLSVIVVGLVWESARAQQLSDEVIQNRISYVSAKEPITFSATEQSRLWIEGSTNVSKFQCNAIDLNGTGQVSDNRLQWSAATETNGDAGIQTSATIAVRVYSLDCGKARMNQDMYNALKAEQHRFIRFRLENAESPHILQADSVNAAEPWYQFKVYGLLQIAGVEKEVVLPVQTELLDSNRLQFRLKGSHKLKMTSFDIKPPSAIYGLIKADNELTVHFDLIVQPQESELQQLEASME